MIEQKEITGLEILEAKVQHVIKCMKNRKDTGANGLSAEINNMH